MIPSILVRTFHEQSYGVAVSVLDPVHISCGEEKNTGNR